MAFQVSPGVNVSEVDLTTVVPAVSTTEGAIAGVFEWGPVEQRVLVDSETSLVSRFGEPKASNFETFFTASNFLNYGNKLYVVRTVSSAALNSTGIVSGSGGNTSGVLIKNKVEFDAASYTANADHIVVAKYPGAKGDGLKVEICDSAAAFESNVTIATAGNTSHIASGSLDFVTGSLTANLTIITSGTGITNTQASAYLDEVVADIQVGDLIKVGNSSIGEQKLQVKSIAADSSDVLDQDGGGSNIISATRVITFENRYTLATNISETVLERSWGYVDNFDAAPGTSPYVEGKGGAGDEVHVVVVDGNGDISGVKGTILEKWSNLSRATDAKNESGESLYWKDKIDNSSNWIYVVNNPLTSGLGSAMAALSTALPRKYDFSGGADGNGESAITLGDLAVGYDLFSDAADVDISLLLTGKAVGGSNGEGLLNYIIDNICEVRKDCVVFGSPDRADVVDVTSLSTQTDNVIAFRNSCRSSSYGIIDSGYKYQYDKFGDVYRYVPLNGDIAGLCARTDGERDAWFSPGGFNRGQIKNVVKLAFNPRLAFRDQLYKAGVNPVVSFPGQGTVLFGDKTLLAKPSAFDRINVRRLFIVLEKAISNAAQFSLFEFNDEFTRAQFVNLIEPFLRDVQGRRGIYDFRVVCDDSNNTGEVIDRNEFVGDIYVKPAKSINFIQLNFVAVRSGVEFSEVVGKF
jgi:hypothetical protein